MEEFEKIIKRHLKTLLTDLKKCKSKKKYTELLSIYYVIDQLLKNIDLDIDYHKDFQYELNKYESGKYDKVLEYSFIDNYDIMYDYNLEVSNIYKSMEPRYLGVTEYKNYIDITNNIKNVQSFFKDYDKDIYNYFNEQILDKGLIILTDKVKSGFTSLSNYILPPYSFINPKLCAKDYITIIHETVHSYIRNRLRYISFEQLNTMLVNNLEEVFPIFTELCAIKYANDNKILNELNLYKNDMYTSLYTYLKKYNENLVNSDIIDYMINERYAYGFLLAYQYYNNHGYNKETKQKVLKLSLESPFHDKKYLLNNYGMNQFDILSSAKYLNNIK